jgi:hypothetical protein
MRQRHFQFVVFHFLAFAHGEADFVLEAPVFSSTFGALTVLDHHH